MGVGGDSGCELEAASSAGSEVRSVGGQQNRTQTQALDRLCVTTENRWQQSTWQNLLSPDNQEQSGETLGSGGASLGGEARHGIH